MASSLTSLIDRYLSPVPVDAFVASINPLWAQKGAGRIEAIRPLSATAAAISIRPSRGWTAHQPGQYVTVGVEVNGVLHHRCYSLTSLPTPAQRTIEIMVQAVPDGIVSNHLVRFARQGDLLTLSEPLGSFTLPSQPEPLMLIAGGSGITPLLGMVRTLAYRSTTWLTSAGRSTPPPVTLLHYALDKDRALCTTELDALARTHDWFDYQLILNGESGEMLTPATLDRICPEWQSRAAYACGPVPILDSVESIWEAAGISPLLRTERFVLAPISFEHTATPDDASDATITVGFATSKTSTRQCSNQTLLEVAEAAGVPAKSGCRAGVCHTCATRLVDGSAMDLRDGRIYEPGDFVQTCVAAATSDLILDL